ncbi:MAG: hypothetical protein JNK61_02890 [Bacteroidia bacterium]|nr:hypothetical protein [Bacteroidia bacterium]HQU99765.1 hypothetical protein [Bacteroidia bacterium]
MKNLNFIAALLLATTALTSCQKENTSTPFYGSNNHGQSAKESDYLYLKDVINTKGEVCQSFVYNDEKKLIQINMPVDVSQSFIYDEKGNLESATTLDGKTSQVTEQLVFLYNDDASLPHLMNTYINEGGALKLMAVTKIEWTAEGLKKHEHTTLEATQETLETLFEYSDDNASIITKFKDGNLASTKVIKQYDDSENPYAKIKTLRLLPGFEWFKNNTVFSFVESNGNVENFTNEITYDEFGLPRIIKTVMDNGEKTSMQFTYDK